jgi:hypothetical protein
MLGHATVAVTLDIYSHVLPDMQQDAALAMGGLLFEEFGAAEVKALGDPPAETGSSPLDAAGWTDDTGHTPLSPGQ